MTLGGAALRPEPGPSLCFALTAFSAFAASPSFSASLALIQALIHLDPHFLSSELSIAWGTRRVSAWRNFVVGLVQLATAPALAVVAPALVV